MDKNSKIYIAGHRGLVGSALVRTLQNKGFENLLTCKSSELDLRRQSEVESFFAKERPDYVFLAAAKVGGIVANSTYVAEFIYDNLMIASNVINSAYKYQTKKLLNLGSSCIYPKFAPQPLKEEYLLTDELEATNEPYAIAKIAAIKLCRYYNQQYGTNFISAMPTNLYGIDDNFDLETSHVLPALIRKFHLAKILKSNDVDALRINFKLCSKNYDPATTENEMLDYVNKHGITKDTVTLWGSGSPLREFLYVDDLADACLFLMENEQAASVGEIINVGSGKDLAIKELAELVKSVVGFDGEIKWDTAKPDGTPRKLMDSSRISTLGWKAKVDLTEGIEKVYNNFVVDKEGV